MPARRGYLNMHKLSGLSVNKFSDKLEELFEGKHLYRTIDGRILDFGRGVEHFPSIKFKLKQTQLHHEQIRHINRKEK
jgi:hypothetical protein